MFCLLFVFLGGGFGLVSGECEWGGVSLRPAEVDALGGSCLCRDFEGRRDSV